MIPVHVVGLGMSPEDLTPRAWEIIREMKGELLAVEEQGHDEPGEPTAGHH